MKPYFIVPFFIFFGLLIPVFGEASTPIALPNFETQLQTEKFVIKELIKDETYYGFATNKSFDELQKLLIESLGDGWKIQVAPDRIIKMLSKERNLQLKGFGRLLHKDYEDFTITVTLTPMPKKFKTDENNHINFLSIVTVNSNLTKHLKSAVEQDATPNR